MQLRINPLFRDLIPPLSEGEFAALEASILALGRCRDTIKIWRGAIIDGHNRYAICQRHGISFDVQKMHFRSNKEAELWIVENQLGRRNLTNVMRIKLALRKEALLRGQARINRAGIQDSRPVHVRKAIAKEAGVSEQTVYKYMKVRELAPDEVLALVDAGEVNISAAHRALSSAAPALEVTSTIVERYHGSQEPADISNPLYKAAAQDNIVKIEKILGFVAEHAPLVRDGHDLPKVMRKLAGLKVRYGEYSVL